MGELTGLFDEPSAAYRGKPFWSWNGNLKERELMRQMGVLRGMGMGGFFMHSRTGLQTEYLGREWFRLINACADESVKMGMEAWLYDEDRWPSGTAGGLVTKNPQFRQQFVSLRAVPGEQFQWNDNFLAAFACRLEGLNFSDAVRLTRDTLPSAYAAKTVLVFTVEPMDPNSFFNGYTDVDRLNKAATMEFIRLTHEKYRQNCGNRLGGSIKGIFTDEPHRGAAFTGFSLSNTNKYNMTPWTGALPEEFQKRFGYDIVDKLPELFLRKDGEAVAQVKWQYMELLQAMFLENFMKPIQDWCRTNHMIFTGHALHEDSLSSQSAMQGSLMRFYEYQDYPGIDILTEGNRHYWVAKQVSSAARQLGKPWLLSELYGCTGWQFNFESHKYVGDWQALFGINVRCQHLSWYTMEGEAKRDYPASIFFQSAWCSDYKYVEDYFSRLGVILNQGKPECNVLVLNPVESVWCQIGAGWGQGLEAKTPALKALEKNYSDLFGWLAGNQVDFDYADEEMLSRLGKPQRDKWGKPFLQVGQATYGVVLVPPMTTIRLSTLNQLAAFRNLGGKVVFAGAPAPYTEGVKANTAASVASYSLSVPFDQESVIDALRKSVRLPVTLADASGKPVEDIFCQLRSDGKHQYLVAMNMNRQQAYENISLRVWGDYPYAAEWDCTSGKHYEIPTLREEGWVKLQTSFYPVGTRVFVLGKQPEEGLEPRTQYKEIARQTCQGPYEYELGEKNVCVLDRAQYLVGNEKYHPEMEILKIDRTVRQQFGLPFRSGQMVQPWFRKLYEKRPTRLGDVRLNFGFEIGMLPPKGLELCLEHPENFTLLVNGRPLPLKSTGWWVDPAIHTVALPVKFLRQGHNELELKTEFRENIDLEAIYLIGKFGVKVDGTQKTLTPLPARINASDLTSQGFPFYGGAITYKVPVSPKLPMASPMFIETPKFEAACVKVSVGPQPPKYIAWQPYEAEVTAAPSLKRTIDVEVVLTRRNTFGPLHQVPLKAAGYGPPNWVTEGKGFTDNYQLYPAGLLTDPVLSARQAQ